MGPGGRGGDFHESRMQQLEQNLGIADEQKEAWSEYRKTTDALHEEMQGFMEGIQEERANTENPYTVQAKMWDFRKAHFEKMNEARRKLMESLNPQQAAIAEDFFGGMGPMGSRW